MAGELNEFLEHYGVKGMRWGVRKVQSKVDKLETRAKRAADTSKGAQKLAEEHTKTADELESYANDILSGTPRRVKDVGEASAVVKSLKFKDKNTYVSDILEEASVFRDLAIMQTQASDRWKKRSEELQAKANELKTLKQSDLNVDSFLEHYGVKGMRWGVRKEYEGKSESKAKSNSEPTAAQKKALEQGNAIFAAKAETLGKKYGPESSGKNTDPKESRLTDEQKALLKTALVGGAVIGGLYVANRVANSKLQDYVVGEQLGPGVPAAMHTFWKDHIFTPHAPRLKDLSTEAVDLAPGSILKRISMDSEGSIRPQGFYAAFKDSDVARYKAALPIYWKRWVGPAVAEAPKEGFVVNILAKNGVKAPSPRDTLNLFNRWAAAAPEAKALGLKPNNYNDFYNFGHGWSADGPATRSFFSFLKAQGYNAVVDINDAGGLAETPLRMFSSDGFAIAAVEKLSKGQIRAAQEAITVLTHFMFGDDSMKNAKQSDASSFLEHYGVKGMRWGVRRSDAQLSRARGRKEADKAIKKKRKQTAKNRRLMSEKDIDKAIERFQKEKKLKDLTDQDIAPGKTIAKRIMSDSGQKVLRTAVAGAGIYAVAKAVEIKFGKGADGQEHDLVRAIKKGGFNKK